MDEGEFKKRIWAQMPMITLAILEKSSLRIVGKSEKLTEELAVINTIVDEGAKDFPIENHDECWGHEKWCIKVREWRSKWLPTVQVKREETPPTK